MYVPTFQGLGAGDFVRSAEHHRTEYPFDARHQVRFYRARNAIYHLFQALRPKDQRLTALVPDYNSGNEVLAMRAAGVTVQYYPVGPDGQIDLSVVEQFCDTHNPDVLYVIHYLGWPQPMWALTDLCRQRGILVVEVGNSAARVRRRFRGLPLVWLEFQQGFSEVFLLRAADLPG